jgi:gamma-glutamyltranspeptidase/glutathione hydrolase
VIYYLHAQELIPVIEATKFAYGQRATLGDPAFTSNVSSLEQTYITEDVASLARAKISDNQTHPSAYYTPSGYIPTQEFGTSYLATVDGNGMAISLTTTVNLYWGSRVSEYQPYYDFRCFSWSWVTHDGIILNNEMVCIGHIWVVRLPTDFRTTSDHQVKPTHSVSHQVQQTLSDPGNDHYPQSPALETGKFVMATGSAGGSQIITATIQQLHHFIDQGLNATESTRQYVPSETMG